MSRRTPRSAIRAMRSAPTLHRVRPEAALESAAAEFALLAQRRARLRRQTDLLDRQRQAAAEMMAQVEARMVDLTGRMTALAPPLSSVSATPDAPAGGTPPRRGALMNY
jgi:phage shock protein A